MSANTQSMDHRLGTRVRLNATGRLLAADGTTAQAVVIEASLSGAFVQIPLPLPVLSRVRLRVYAASGQWMEACVVRRTRGGVGVEWLEPGEQAVCELLALREPGNPPGSHPDPVAWKLRRLHSSQIHAGTGDS